MASFSSTNIADFIKAHTYFKFKIGDKTRVNTTDNEPRNDAEAIAHSLAYGAVRVKKTDGAWTFSTSYNKIIYHSATHMRTFFVKSCEGDVNKYAHHLIMDGWYSLSPTIGPHATDGDLWIEARQDARNKAKTKPPKAPKSAGGSAKDLMPNPSVDVEVEEVEPPKKRARDSDEDQDDDDDDDDDDQHQASDKE
jgi:hypothetical protein